MVLKVNLTILLVVPFYAVFDNFILEEELFAKDLRSLENCVLTDNIL